MSVVDEVHLADVGDIRHAAAVRGAPISTMSFGDGFVFDGSWGRVTPANLTPDASVISYYDEHLFVDTLRTGRVVARSLNQIMPWHVYLNMTDDDLKAIFGYLKMLPPVRHHVDNSLPPTFCPLDQTLHGAGDSNQESSEGGRVAAR